jgi:hypothetical protein
MSDKSESSVSAPPRSASACPGRKHCVGLRSALHDYTKAPYKRDLLRETLRALNRPGWARTEDSSTPKRCCSSRSFASTCSRHGR